jgi:phosphoglycerate dehydrogenase-like enzyme
MKILLTGRADTRLVDEVRAAAPGAVVLTSADLQADPAAIDGVEIVFGGLKREQWEQAAELRWVQTMGAGVNGLLTPELVARDVTVTNASGIHAEPITEQMFGLLLMHTRRLAAAWDQQRERVWNSRRLSERLLMLAGKTLGVLGVGAIGRQSARVGEAFGMHVVGLRRTGEPCPHVARMYTPEQRLAFFSECDVVMNSLPLTEKTRRFMGAAEFAALRPGAIVINTGRGGTIDTEALIESLRSGRLGAALLDVTDPEPLPADHPLWSMENVIITPHYAGGHPGYDERAAAIFLDNLRRYVAGEPLRNVVDKREGY